MSPAFWRHTLLTVGIFGPLLWAFITVNNFYPVPVWSLFSEAVNLQQGRTYYVLRGTTIRGETVDLPAIRITGGLCGRNHMMVYYVMGNASFEIDYPHPDNVALIARRGGVTSLHQAERVDSLLRAWGTSYNRKVGAGSPKRLTAIRLDEYRWPGGAFENYRQFVRKYEVAL